MNIFSNNMEGRFLQFIYIQKNSNSTQRKLLALYRYPLPVALTNNDHLC